MQRRTLPIPATLVDELDRLGAELESLGPDSLHFERKSRRSRISTSEVASVALEIGINEIRRQHGLADEAV